MEMKTSWVVFWERTAWGKLFGAGQQSEDPEIVLGFGCDGTVGQGG